jgi:hypothetical protein
LRSNKIYKIKKHTIEKHKQSDCPQGKAEKGIAGKLFTDDGENGWFVHEAKTNESVAKIFFAY